MKKTYKMKKFWILISVLIIFLIITNPNMKNFKDYVGSNTYRDLRRLNNFLFFSIYEDEYGTKYIGICLNFTTLSHLKRAPVITVD